MVKAVYVEVSVAPEQRIEEAEYAIALCERGGPTAAATIGGSPGAEDFRDYITRFKGNKYVKGVRESWKSGNHEDKRFLAGLRLLGELGMSFDLLVSGDALDEAAEAVKACPDTRFVLDHCGGGSPTLFTAKAIKDGSLGEAREQWRQRIATLAGLKNVVCKISGVAESGPEEAATLEAIAPIVDQCIHDFGQERVMFGGNWPVCEKAITIWRWVDLLKKIREGEETRRRLFHDNAAKLYGFEA